MLCLTSGYFASNTNALKQLPSILHILLLSVVTLLQLDLGYSHRILATFFFPARSHSMITNAIIRELVKRGHEVTFITSMSMAKENLGPNYKEIPIPPYEIWPEIQELTKRNSVLEMTDVDNLTFLRMVNLLGVATTDFAFEQPGVKELIHAKDKVGKYDLLLAEQFFNEGALILGHLYQIPIITIATFGFANYLSQLFGVVSPWSYVPHVYLPYTDKMTLWERIHNVAFSGFEDLLREFSYYPRQDAILQKHFSKSLDRVPTIKELERNISAVLLNSHVPLFSPRPLSYNMIQCAGLHILPPKALPEEIKQFLDEATHGAIYFSLGSQVRSAEMPPEKLKIFLDVFSSLQQRVLWKFENESVKLPPNVKVKSWLPQADILAHPNVKVFIGHGGANGVIEAIHYGVPMLGMAVYSDQYHHVNQGKKAGYLLGLDYRTVTEEELKGLLLELIENPKYKNNMKQASKVFRDRPLNAMDTAMYWINYVIEHRGAPHIVSAGVQLPWYQFYLLDIVGLALVLILLPLLLLALVCRRRSPEKKPKQE
ncbi:UDP-glucosyltransferase 2-like [Drosophila kikkawai]|uniref:UDP-glucosyltransferase 2-like n=1 Tax=Drosophila kikkawai TaxID=30033 RepID=A0A6P4JC37_DROKI|nr:UDP-glucosyltransferase 2-like [Drosophila kikkawai]